MAEPQSSSEPSVQKPARPVRRSQAERREETRRRAIDAAIECISQEGYAATTTVTVAKRAKISRGGILHHFPTKIDLIAGVMEEIERRMHGQRRDAIMTHPKGLDRFMALTDVTWLTMQSAEALVSIEILMALRGDEELSRRLPDVADALDRYQLDGTLRLAKAAGIENDPLIEAMHTLHQAAFRGLAIELLFTRNRGKIDAAIELLHWYKKMLVARLQD